VPVLGVPEQVEDEDYEQRLERVAAIDVAKASGKVCTRVPHESKAGKRVTLVWDVPATTNAICELAAHLVEQPSSGWCWSRRRITGDRSSTCSRPRG
jgi:transposase